jgi:hypothetical protein
MQTDKEFACSAALCAAAGKMPGLPGQHSLLQRDNSGDPLAQGPTAAAPLAGYNSIHSRPSIMRSWNQW